MLTETVVADRGRVFTSKNWKDVYGQLGITLEPNPKESPWLIGQIERFFKTINTSDIHVLPRTSSSNEEGDEDSAK
jgi:transposase InsO family protein